MKKILLCLLLILLLIIIIYIVCNNIFVTEKENFADNIKQENEASKTSWNVNTCPYIVTENIKKVFEENNIKENNENSESNIYLPCTYDNIEKEIENMNLKKDKQNKVFIIHNADQIVAKDYLWKNLVAKYGLDECLTLMPMTYILYENNDVKRLKEEYEENKLFILKKNIQRQEGLKICNNLDDIIKNKTDYVLAQELLQDPYLINGRKINLRIYVLVVCNKDMYDVYAYNDGFMYYTKDLFKQNSLDFGPNITTGYIDRWVYDVNPLTHQDFREYLDKNTRDLTSVEESVKNKGIKLSKYVFNNINELIKKVFSAFHGKIGNGEKLYDHLSFQLFGVDVAIDENLDAKIMEVNKGPDLGSKDKRDGDLKKGLIKDILKIINAIENDDNNKFVKVYSL
jgi:hypothetical protein